MFEPMAGFARVVFAINPEAVMSAYFEQETPFRWNSALAYGAAFVQSIQATASSKSLKSKCFTSAFTK